jgi:hypothetical protein
VNVTACPCVCFRCTECIIMLSFSSFIIFFFTKEHCFMHGYACDECRWAWVWNDILTGCQWEDEVIGGLRLSAKPECMSNRRAFGHTWPSERCHCLDAAKTAGSSMHITKWHWPIAHHHHWETECTKTKLKLTGMRFIGPCPWKRKMGNVAKITFVMKLMSNTKQSGYNQHRGCHCLWTAAASH